MKCSICKQEIVPGEDRCIQVREGYISTGEYQDFIPDHDIELNHSGCFDGVEYPPPKP